MLVQPPDDHPSTPHEQVPHRASTSSIPSPHLLHPLSSELSQQSASEAPQALHISSTRTSWEGSHRLQRHSTSEVPKFLQCPSIDKGQLFHRRTGGSTRQRRSTSFAPQFHHQWSAPNAPNEFQYASNSIAEAPELLYTRSASDECLQESVRSDPTRKTQQAFHRHSTTVVPELSRRLSTRNVEELFHRDTANKRPRLIHRRSATSAPQLYHSSAATTEVTHKQSTTDAPGLLQHISSERPQKFHRRSTSDAPQQYHRSSARYASQLVLCRSLSYGRQLSHHPSTNNIQQLGHRPATREVLQLYHHSSSSKQMQHRQSTNCLPHLSTNNASSDLLQRSCSTGALQQSHSSTVSKASQASRSKNTNNVPCLSDSLPKSQLLHLSSFSDIPQVIVHTPSEAWTAERTTAITEALDWIKSQLVIY